MKAIKSILCLLAVLILFSNCEESIRDEYSNEDGRFVRFNFQIDNDSLPVDHSLINPSSNIADAYACRQTGKLSIPVSMTTETLNDTVKVFYSVSLEGTYSAFKIYPETLSFMGGHLTDTIYVEFLERWNDEEENHISFTLDSVSDPEIQIGFPNRYAPHDRFEITLEELILRYHLNEQTMFEITGQTGEEVILDVIFPDGFFYEDIESNDLLALGLSDFNYSLTRLPLETFNDRVRFIVTLNEAINVDAFDYSAYFQLDSLDGYVPYGITKYSIVKPILIERDNTINIAAHFYDLSYSFYRTYGYTWMDYNHDDSCVWQSYNQFTYPVVVDEDHPNAVLYDDKGTTDKSDDIYHHAFRVGFDSPNEGRTINSFNLKRILENEYTDADLSPGFNMPNALDFYPKDGVSKTEGTVRVVKQDALISSKDEKSYIISIGGEGTYTEISEGVFELSFILRLTNDEVFGGTIEVPNVLWNTSEVEKPAPMSSACVEPYEL